MGKAIIYFIMCIFLIGLAYSAIYDWFVNPYTSKQDRSLDYRNFTQNFTLANGFFFKGNISLTSGEHFINESGDTMTGDFNVTGTLYANNTKIYNNLTAGNITAIDDLQVADDILLGSGSAMNWNSGDITLTHSANALTFAGMTTLGLGSGDLTTTGTISPLVLDMNKEFANFYVGSSNPALPATVQLCGGGWDSLTIGGCDVHMNGGAITGMGELSVGALTASSLVITGGIDGIGYIVLNGPMYDDTWTTSLTAGATNWQLAGANLIIDNSLTVSKNLNVVKNFSSSNATINQVLRLVNLSVLPVCNTKGMLATNNSGLWVCNSTTWKIVTFY